MPSSYAVGEHFERFIKKQVQGGRYASASEVVRDALRLLEEQERMRLASLDILRDEIRKGLDSGVGKPAVAGGANPPGESDKGESDKGPSADHRPRLS